LAIWQLEALEEHNDDDGAAERSFVRKALANPKIMREVLHYYWTGPAIFVRDEMKEEAVS
jgi:hypothetical protein